jgi:hypothetical protein
MTELASPFNREVALKEINNGVTILARGYFVWYGIYVFMVITSVGLPGIAALSTEGEAKYLAGVAAIFAGIMHALKPHEIASGYDAGLQMAWKAQASLRSGTIDVPTALTEFRQAIDLTTFKYGLPTTR